MFASNINNFYKMLVTNLYKSRPNINMYSKQQLLHINAYLLYLIAILYNFSTATNYTLMFNLVNPSYSDTFSIQAFNGWTSFRNSGSVAINPKTIRCSIASNSQIVSQL